MNGTTCLICEEVVIENAPNRYDEVELVLSIGLPVICENCLPLPDDSVNDLYN